MLGGRCIPNCPSLQILRVLDHLFAFGEFHVSFLPVTPVAFVLATATHLPMEIRGADIGDLNLEDLLHRFLDFRLAGSRGDFKHNGVLRLLHSESLLGGGGTLNNLIVRGRHRLFLPLLGCRLFRRRFLGRRLRGRFWRRFLLGCRRRSNRFDLRRFRGLAVRIKGTNQPRRGILRNYQMIVAQHVVRLQNVGRRKLHAVQVAAGEFEVAVATVRDEQRGLFRVQFVERSAQSNIFFGSAYSYVRGFGPCTVPPWRHKGERIEPMRARPVPFCRQSLRPAPLTSLFSLVLCVPRRRPARYQREASCRRCLFTSAPKTVSASSTWPTFLPSKLTTSTTGMICFLLSNLLPSSIGPREGGPYKPYFAFFAAFLALWMKMYVPLGPGTEPRTNSRFSSVSTLITFKFFAVTLALPRCPGKCWFFHTRDGNELPPMPPGAR